MVGVRLKVASAMAGAALLYLGSGATAFAQTTTYSYDVFGRLSSVTTGGGAQTTYAYDAADNRTQVVKTSGAQVIGTAERHKARHWLQFGLGRKRSPGIVKSVVASATPPAAPLAPTTTSTLPSSLAASRMALANAGR